jgi:hypothetical protein
MYIHVFIYEFYVSSFFKKIFYFLVIILLAQAKYNILYWRFHNSIIRYYYLRFKVEIDSAIDVYILKLIDVYGTVDFVFCIMYLRFNNYRTAIIAFTCYWLITINYILFIVYDKSLLNFFKAKMCRSHSCWIRCYTYTSHNIYKEINN